MSSSELDAVANIDQTSLTFGATGEESSFISCVRKAKDVNQDGLKDLVCTFSVKTAFKNVSRKAG